VHKWSQDRILLGGDGGGGGGGGGGSSCSIGSTDGVSGNTIIFLLCKIY
jgi:hypothetical protein